MNGQMLKPQPGKNRIVEHRRTSKPQRRKDFSGIAKSMQLLGSAFLKFTYLVFVLILVSLLFIAGYEFLQQTPMIKLQSIRCSGIGPALRDELLKAAELNSETSLLSVNLERVKKIMEAHPWVRQVELEKQYPHTLIIRAEEQKVRAVVFSDTFRYINSYGEAFKEVEPQEPLDYPILTGLSWPVDPGDAAFQKAINVLDILEAEKSPWSVHELSEVHIQKDGRLMLYFCSLPAAIDVRESELAVKMEELKKVVAHLRNTGQLEMVRRIDLNTIDGIVVSYKKSKQPDPTKG